MHVEAGDVRDTFARGEQSDQHLDRRRLAGAVGAKESEHFAGLHVEGDVIDGDERSESARQILGVDREAVGLRCGCHAAAAVGGGAPPISSMKLSSIPALIGAT